MDTNSEFASGRVPFTWCKMVIAGVLACAPAMTASASSPVAAQQARSIDWSFESNGPGKDGSEVQLTVDSRWGPGNHAAKFDRRMSA
jgi:hypothetical protein